MIATRWEGNYLNSTEQNGRNKAFGIIALKYGLTSLVRKFDFLSKWYIFYHISYIYLYYCYHNVSSSAEAESLKE